MSTVLRNFIHPYCFQLDHSAHIQEQIINLRKAFEGTVGLIRLDSALQIKRWNSVASQLIIEYFDSDLYGKPLPKKLNQFVQARWNTTSRFFSSKIQPLVIATKEGFSPLQVTLTRGLRDDERLLFLSLEESGSMPIHLGWEYLTQLEEKILNFLLLGYSHKEIACQLDMKENAVSQGVRRMCQKRGYEFTNTLKLAIEYLQYIQ